MVTRNIKQVVKKAVKDDARIRDVMNDASATNQSVVDSFNNFAQKLGMGADNALTTSSYGFNPITRVKTLLEWIHRGSWLGGVAIDVHADDMTRAGVDLKGKIAPDDIERINQNAAQLKVWQALRDTVAWSRLYGGCLAVMLIDGQELSTPLRMETIGKNAFKGLMVLDRWMVDPSLNNLVTEYGPHLGLPKFYSVTADAPALPHMKIHYSRVIRLEGIRLPYHQRLMENLWGISVLERVYDRMVSFDSATTGASQLVYKAYIRTYKIQGMKKIVAAGGDALDGLTRYVEMMRRFQGIEGVTLMDGDDEFDGITHNAFSGLSDALVQFGQQVSGALQIPLVRLFGQSPAGFSTGETDLRNYYDAILQHQESEMHHGVLMVYKAIAASLGIKTPDGFDIEFRSLWQLSEVEKANIASSITSAVVQAKDAGVISEQTAMKELRQSAHKTGVYTNISDEDIEAAALDMPPSAEELISGGGQPAAPGANEGNK